MKRMSRAIWYGLCGLLSLVLAGAGADLECAGILGDNMVLQQGQPVPVWGMAAPGNLVTVRFADQAKDVVAGTDGHWMIRLAPLAASSEPRTLTISSGEHRLTYSNVLIGEVWLCSGQSNMELGIGRTPHGNADIASADFPSVRLIRVPRRQMLRPSNSLKASWLVCSPSTVARGEEGGFSALAFCFGRRLHKELGVPVGLIESAVGATEIQAWMSLEALKPLSCFAFHEARLKQLTVQAGTSAFDFGRAMNDWWNENDPGSRPESLWSSPGFDDAAWETLHLPMPWTQRGFPGFEGVGWLRKEIEIPADWKGKRLFIHLGSIDEQDTTWFNGTVIGSHVDWTRPRDYYIDPELVEPGRAVIAVRVLTTGGGGRVCESPEPIALSLAGDTRNRISLEGNWRFRRSTPLSKTSPIPVYTKGEWNQPTTLFNGMIAPLFPFAIRGVAWYQGEWSAGRAHDYSALLTAMIADWRYWFESANLPFLIVQLPNFLPLRSEPNESTWGELRQAQLQVTRSVPQVSLVVTLDTAGNYDMHPNNKPEVARRLALAAFADVYGKSVESSGPIVREAVREGAVLRLKFDHVGGGLVVKGGTPLRRFALAGKEGVFVWADAQVDGETVIVSSAKIPEPLVVRYGWDYGQDCNLFNQAGLPASPFQITPKQIRMQ